MLIRKQHNHAAVCCENGFKWYLFAFYNLEAILCSTGSSSFFGASAFLKSAKVLRYLKGQVNNGCMQVSKGKAIFLLNRWRKRVRQDGSSRVIFIFLSYNDHFLAFRSCYWQHRVLCENPTSLRRCLNSNNSPFFDTAKIRLSKETIIDL
jgi:hypothetical protein